MQGDLYENTITLVGPETIVSRGANVLGRWSHRAAGGSEFKLQLYADRTDRDANASYDETLTTYDLDFQHQLPVGTRHNVVWGAGYRQVRDDFHSGTIGLLHERVTLETFSAFVQDEIALIPDQLHFTLGTKIEDNDYTGTELQPSVRLAWKLHDKQTLWSAVSRALRTPARLDRDYYIPPVILGSPDLQSEKLIAYELGYRVQPNERLSLSVAGYFNDYDDIRSIEPVNPPAPIPLEFRNGQEGESYGVELSAEYRVTDTWRLRADVFELRIDIDPKPGSLDNSHGSVRGGGFGTSCVAAFVARSAAQSAVRRHLPLREPRGESGRGDSRLQRARFTPGLAGDGESGAFDRWAEPAARPARRARRGSGAPGDGAQRLRERSPGAIDRSRHRQKVTGRARNSPVPKNISKPMPTPQLVMRCCVSSSRGKVQLIRVSSTSQSRAMLRRYASFTP